jgi:hypothetical protein
VTYSLAGYKYFCVGEIYFEALLVFRNNLYIFDILDNIVLSYSSL